MSRASVRAAVTSYLAATPITGVGAVLPSRPKIAQAPQFDPAPLGGSGAVLIVHLTDDHRIRDALGGVADGQKVVKHQIALEVIFRSVKPDATAAQADHDTILDALVSLIEADRTFGGGYDPTTNEPAGPIWQAGEGPAGITVEMAEPVEVDQTIAIDAVIRFEAWELIRR